MKQEAKISHSDLDDLCSRHIVSTLAKSFQVSNDIERNRVDMKIDTGAAASLIKTYDFIKLKKDGPILPIHTP